MTKELTEHEKLAEIMLKIKYPNFERKEEAQTYYSFVEGEGIVNDSGRIIDVREIIFTKEFIDKLLDWRNNNAKTIYQFNIVNCLIEHCDNPVDYLYDIIKRGIQQEEK